MHVEAISATLVAATHPTTRHRPTPSRITHGGRISPPGHKGRATSREEAEMAVQGPFKVECGELFPHGLGVVGEVTALDDFDKSTKDNRVQARDKDTGLPLWQVEVLDFDQQAREKTFKVKIAAAVQPVPPESVAQVPVRPVVLEGLTVTPYIKDGNRPRIAYSLRCTGLAAPGRRRSPSRVRRPSHVRDGQAGGGVADPGPLGRGPHLAVGADPGLAVQDGRQAADRHRPVPDGDLSCSR